MRKQEVDLVGERLRAEGRAGSPEYSALLHARVMARLHEKGLDEEDADQSLLPARWRDGMRIGLGLAVAACVVVGAILLTHAPEEVKGPGPVAKEDVWLPTIRPGELVAPMVEAAGEPAAAVQDARFGHMEKDAQRLAIFVASQMPTFEAEKKK